MQYTFECPYSDNAHLYKRCNYLLKNKIRKGIHNPYTNWHQNSNPNIESCSCMYNNFKELIGMFYTLNGMDNKFPYCYLKILNLFHSISKITCMLLYWGNICMCFCKLCNLMSLWNISHTLLNILDISLQKLMLKMNFLNILNIVIDCCLDIIHN